LDKTIQPLVNDLAEIGEEQNTRTTLGMKE
jgi:hypothetical protein